MIKAFVFAQVILTILSGDCNSYNPVCGKNGVTYANSCKCQSANIEVSHVGACGGQNEYQFKQFHHQAPKFDWSSQVNNNWAPKQGSWAGFAKSGNWFNNVNVERKDGNAWKNIGVENVSGNRLNWNDSQTRRYDGLQNYQKGWSTAPLQNNRSFNYTVSPVWNYRYNWIPNEPKQDIYVKAQPIIKQQIQSKKWVDDFQFPAWKPAQKLPFPEADWSINPALYQSTNPKKLFVSSDGVWATHDENAELPQLYTSSIGGWSGALRGDLDNVQYQRQPLKYLGSKEIYNNWRDLSQKELIEGGAAKLSDADKEKARQAAEGAFDNVNFKDFGYRLMSEPQSQNSNIQNMINDSKNFKQQKDDSAVKSWLDSLRSKATVQGSGQKSQGAKEVYNISYSDVKGNGETTFNSASQNPIQKASGWNYNFNSGNNIQNSSQGFNNNFTSGNYGFTSNNGQGNGNGFGTGNGSFGGQGSGFGAGINTFQGKTNSQNGFVGDSLIDGGLKFSGNNGQSGLFPNGWYDMYTYQNSGNGYFLPNSQFYNQSTDFGTLGTTNQYNLVDGKWVITHEGDSWINSLPSAGGKQMVGASAV